jgi:hypothetical protein
MARSNDHDDRHPDDPTFRPGAVNPVPTPPQPAPPPPSTLAPLEQARRNELLAKPEGERSAQEKTELQALEAKNALKPMPEDQIVRLRDLRLLHERNQLNDADKAELAKLNAAESEAAGHQPGEPAKAAPEPVNTFNEILSILDQLIDLDPRYAGIGSRVAAIRARLNPPVEEAKAA